MFRTKSNQVQRYGNGYKRINMTNNVTIITDPDDILIEGVRILLVDLTPDQSEFISTSLFQLEDFPTTVIYSWKLGDGIPWLFDKFYKSSIVFFNAESFNQTLVGFFAGKSHAFYFGTLQSLNQVNTREISNIDQSIAILTKLFENYDT